MFSKATTANILLKRAEDLKNRMSAKKRCDLAQDMGTLFQSETLSEQEYAIAESIVQKLIEDEITMVRTAISEAVARSPYLSAPIAEKLAQDILEVSIPFLKLSPVLEDKLLEEIIDSGVTEKIRAIAERPEVSENLSRRIVASGKTNCVIQLLKNPGAHISDQTMVTIVRVYGDNHKVEKAVFERGKLSGDAIESLRALSEAHVATFIQRYFNLPAHVLSRSQRGEEQDATWWDDKQGVV